MACLAIQVQHEDHCCESDKKPSQSVCQSASQSSRSVSPVYSRIGEKILISLNLFQNN